MSGTSQYAAGSGVVPLAMDVATTADVKAQVVSKTKAVWEQAKALYDLPPSQPLRLVIRPGNKMGRAAGRAKSGRTVELNALALERNLQDMLDDTIPHEVAHIVCQLRPHLGRGHNAGWRRVAQSLGCSAKRCYSLDTYGDLRARKRKQYKYKLDSGRELLVGDVRHKRIQYALGKARYTVDGEDIRDRHWTGEEA